MAIDNMLHVLPTDGEWEIIKKSKYGIWIKQGKTKIFLRYSNTLTEQGLFGEKSNDPTND